MLCCELGASKVICNDYPDKEIIDALKANLEKNVK